MHGGQKIIVFQRGKYIGQYALSPPPYASASLIKEHLWLEFSDTHEKVLMDFSKHPPKKVFIHGEEELFYR